jgi:hypothetical protein
MQRENWRKKTTVKNSIMTKIEIIRETVAFTQRTQAEEALVAA